MDPNRLKIYQRALTDSLLAVPYNSAVQFPKYLRDQEPDPGLGAACVLQTFDAAHRAEVAGATTPVFLQNGRHVAAVFAEGDELVVLDPYLLHTEPIVLPDRNDTSNPIDVTVPALPFRRDTDGVEKTGRLVATLHRGSTPEAYTMSLDYFRFSPAKQRLNLSRHFKLSSGSTIDRSFTGIDVEAMLTHPEQTSLSMRVVNPRTWDLAEAIVPLKGWAKREFTADQVRVRNNDGVAYESSSEPAREIWGAITSATGVDRSTIEENFGLAYGIYASTADPSVELGAYNLDPE